MISTKYPVPYISNCLTPVFFANDCLANNNGRSRQENLSAVKEIVPCFDPIIYRAAISALSWVIGVILTNGMAIFYPKHGFS